MEKKKILKPFDLEKAKQGATIMTECYSKARIVCYDLKANASHPLLVLLTEDGIERPAYYKIDGTSDYYGCYGNLKIVEEIEVPERWRDRNEEVTERFIRADESIVTRNTTFEDIVGPTNEKEARRERAFDKICHIMKYDKRFGGVITDREWLDTNIPKYCFYRYQGHIEKKCCCDNYEFIAFRTREQRELFYQENLDLIEQYFML